MGESEVSGMETLFLWLVCDTAVLKGHVLFANLGQEIKKIVKERFKERPFEDRRENKSLSLVFRMMQFRNQKEIILVLSSATESVHPENRCWTTTFSLKGGATSFPFAMFAGLNFRCH